MRVASVVHTSIHAPQRFINFEFLTTRNSKWMKLRYLHSCATSPFLSVAFKDRSLALSSIHRIKSSNQEGKNTVGVFDDRSDVNDKAEVVERDKAYKTSLKTVVFCVCSAVAFGVYVGLTYGLDKSSEYFAGYILEQSLSIDNLFVFVLIFKYFQVPPKYQNRVLSYGVIGAIGFRFLLILLGTATIKKYKGINLLLAAVLLYSAFKLFSSEEDESDLSNNFVVKTCQRFIPVTSFFDEDRFFTNQDGILKATPLLLTVAVVELSDIAFAVDSIPAVFGVTQDPFIVLSSNLFAILGLRSFYTIISEGMADLEYLQPSIAVVLGFIGLKMILDFFGFHVSTEASLAVVALCLGTGVSLSLLTTKSD